MEEEEENLQKNSVHVTIDLRQKTQASPISEQQKLVKVKVPFLPPGDKKYTLVLDLDETLIHYYEIANEGHLLIRPGAEIFLQEISQFYEYADWVLDQLDKEKKQISYRLYRQHATNAGNFFIKDLSKIGREISKTIIIDNVAENFQLQPDNGIFIKSWFDDPQDTALFELCPLLKCKLLDLEIVNKGVSDVRQALRQFRDQMLKQIAAGIQNPKLSL